jgi:hypothetical protein
MLRFTNPIGTQYIDTSIYVHYSYMYYSYMFYSYMFYSYMFYSYMFYSYTYIHVSYMYRVYIDTYIDDNIFSCFEFLSDSA